MREIYHKNRIITTLTQGSIINNCVSDSFPSGKVWGVIITPRCDMAHEGKVDTVHYLPIVSLHDWFSKFGWRIILHEWENELRNTLNQNFKKLGMGDTIMELHLSKEELMKNLSCAIPSPKDKTRIVNNINDYFSVSKELLKSKSADVRNKKIQSVMKHLRKDEFHEFYLIEKWADVTGQPSGCHMVILLREVRRMRIGVAKRFEKGFYKDTFSQDELVCSDLSLPENDDDNIFGIEAQIISPFIEHIMQSFKYHFCRIGVADREDNNELLITQIENKL